MTQPRTILLVDDDPDLLEQLQLTLTRDGYRVVCAESGEQAEEVLLQERPDLVVCDLMMEEMDSGFLVCHTIQRFYPGTPVIMLTAVTSLTGLDFSSRDRAAQSWTKADRFLHKPIRPAELRGAVRQLLASSARSEPPRPPPSVEARER